VQLNEKIYVLRNVRINDVDADARKKLEKDTRSQRWCVDNVKMLAVGLNDVLLLLD